LQKEEESIKIKWGLENIEEGLILIQNNLDG